MGWLVRVGGSREVIGPLADAVAATWWDLDASGVADVDTEDGRRELIGGFATEESARRARDAIGTARGFDRSLLALSVELDADRWGTSDWQPVPWRDYDIAIQPGQAFGHGLHPTTSLCLTLLADLDLADLTVLDIGTGTGILAIAAALGGAHEVWAVDTDPAALTAATINAAANNVELMLGRTVQGVVPDCDPALILVNMLSTELAGLLADDVVSDLLADCPTIIHSGFLADGEDRADALFTHHVSVDRRVAADTSNHSWVAARRQHR